MARINLNIEADSPEEFWTALRGLAGTPGLPDYVAEDSDPNARVISPETGDEARPTRTRRTKAQIEADNAVQTAGGSSNTSGSAMNASEASQAPQDSSQGRSLADQIAEVTKDDAPAGGATEADLRAAMQKFISTEGKSAPQAQAILMEAVGGKSVSTIPPEKYAEAIAALEMAM